MGLLLGRQLKENQGIPAIFGGSEAILGPRTSENAMVVFVFQVTWDFGEYPSHSLMLIG